MSNNFLISMRNDAGLGIPGLEPGTASFIEIPESAKDYNLRKKISQEQWMGALPATSVIVFVHGYGNGAEKVVSRHNSIKPYIPPGYSLVTFDWPSGNATYDKDKANAKAVAPNLITTCLQALFLKFAPTNIHLFAHSMGAYLTETAFQTPRVTKINHVLMGAADVDQANYQAGSPRLQAFLSNCSNLSAYWSAADEVLPVSERLHGYHPLGLRGFPKPAIADGCNSIECTDYYTRYVKGTPPPHGVSPSEFSHVWYLLFQPSPPPVNDFYTDMGEVLQELPTSPTRTQRGTNDFVLRRPAP